MVKSRYTADKNNKNQMPRREIQKLKEDLMSSNLQKMPADEATDYSI